MHGAIAMKQEPHPLQRSWDALLILHWRRDNKCVALSAQCREMLGKYPNEFAKDGMLRCAEHMHHTMHVRVWVDTYLHPLSVKLWDVDDNKRVLDWVNASTGLDCEASKKARKWQSQGRYQNQRADLNMQSVLLSSRNIYGGYRKMDNVNQVKATGRKSGRN